MQSKLTTKDVGEAVEGLDIISLGLVRRRYLHHQDRVGVLTDAGGSHHGFVGRSCPGLHRVLSVDESFGVRICRHGGCSDNECKSDS